MGRGGRSVGTGGRGGEGASGRGAGGGGARGEEDGWGMQVATVAETGRRVAWFTGKRTAQEERKLVRHAQEGVTGAGQLEVVQKRPKGARVCACEGCRARAQAEWAQPPRRDKKRARAYQVRLAEGSKVRREAEFVRAAAAARAQEAAADDLVGEGQGGPGGEQGAPAGSQDEEEAAPENGCEGARWEWEEWEEEMGSALLNEYEPAFGDG